MGWGDHFRDFRDATNQRFRDGVDEAAELWQNAKSKASDAYESGKQWTANATDVASQQFDSAKNAAKEIAHEVADRTVDAVNATATAVRDTYAAVVDEFDGGPDSTACIPCLLKDGREEAARRNAKGADWTPKIETFIGGRKEMPTLKKLGDAKADDGKWKLDVAIDAKVSKTSEKDSLYFGSDDNFLRVGHQESTKSSGYSYDPLEGEHRIDVINLRYKAAVIEGQFKGTTAKGLLEGKVEYEVLSVDARLTPLSAYYKDSKNYGVESKVGVEAVVAQVEGKAQTNITPKTLYDNTIGRAVGFFDPQSKYVSAVDWLDHGLVLGVAGEAGIGAAAKIEGGFKVDDGVRKLEFGGKLGAGVMAGFKGFIGVK